MPVLIDKKRTGAGSLSAFTGSGNIVFDVGPAISLALSLSCRDSGGSGIPCNEEVEVEAGGTDWAAQFVYDYTPVFDPGLGETPPDPDRIYTGIDGLQIFPAGGGGERDLTFFSAGSPFTPTVVPLPAPLLLLVSGFAVLGFMRRRSLNRARA